MMMKNYTARISPHRIDGNFEQLGIYPRKFRVRPIINEVITENSISTDATTVSVRIHTSGWGLLRIVAKDNTEWKFGKSRWFDAMYLPDDCGISIMVPKGIALEVSYLNVFGIARKILIIDPPNPDVPVFDRHSISNQPDIPLYSTAFPNVSLGDVLAHQLDTEAFRHFYQKI